MSKYKVYISSTFRDLHELRKVIIDYINNERREYFDFDKLMEMMAADGTRARNIDICCDNVRAADIYILLLGKRYGSAPETFNGKSNEGHLSYTHCEFKTAVEMYDRRRMRIYIIEMPDNFDLLLAKTEEEIQQANLKRDNERLIEDISKVTDQKRRIEPAAGDNDIAKEKDLKNKLKIEIRACLDNAHDAFRRLEALNIVHDDKVSIDRFKQLEDLKKYVDSEVEVPKFDYSISRVVGIKVCSIKGSGKDDHKLDFFLEKVRNTYASKAGISSPLIDICNFNLKPFEEENTLMKFLDCQVASYLKDKPAGYTFEDFDLDITERRVQNEFWNFFIEAREDFSEYADQYISWIQKFTNRIDERLKNNKRYKYFIYIVVFIIGEVKCSMDDLFGNSVHKVEVKVPVGLVEADELKKWLRLVIEKDQPDFNKDDPDGRKFNEIFLNIFLDESPKTYKKCLSCIDPHDNNKKN